MYFAAEISKIGLEDSTLHSTFLTPEAGEYYINYQIFLSVSLANIV